MRSTCRRPPRLCGECNRVCPASIPLSDLLRKLREKQMERGLRPWQERLCAAGVGLCRAPPGALCVRHAHGRALAGADGGRNRLIASLPMAGEGWTDARDMPRAGGRTFRELYKEREARA